MTTPVDIDALNRRFGISNHVQFSAASGGLSRVELANAHGRASLVLDGGQVLTYQPEGHAPVLWVSPEARYVAGKSVRGGVPVCWPWFGPHATDTNKPAHGFARNSPWRVVDTQALNDGATRIVLELVPPANHRELWPHDATLQLHVSIGSHLVMELVTHNASDQSLTISEALHTYLHVGDIEQMSIAGLDGVAYVDKVDQGARRIQQDRVRISGEVDRVYLDTEATCVVHDAKLNRRIVVQKQGSRSTVVWNPWADKGQKLGDMGNDGFRRMLCIEAANAIDNTVTVAPQATHRMSTIIHAESGAA